MITVDKATIEFIGEGTIADKPVSPLEGAPVEQVGKLTRFRVGTTDELNLIYGIVEWPAARTEVRPLQFIDGEKKYRRLEKAGRLSVVKIDEDTALAELRVMRHNPEKDYATLAGAPLSTLDSLVNGSITELLMSFGATGVGTREELYGDTSKNRGHLAFTFAPSNREVLAIATVVTRVLAVLYDLGLDD